MPEITHAPLSGLELAQKTVLLVQDKKAIDPLILDLRKISTIADYLVICSAQSEPQLKAIANGVEKGLKEECGQPPLAVDGFPTSQWIVVDYGDVMLHIFHEQKRGVYALEDFVERRSACAPGVRARPALAIRGGHP